jgi:hypothetical protein
MPVALRPHTGISAFFFLSRPRVRKVGVEKVESFSHDAGAGISCRTREGRAGFKNSIKFVEIQRDRSGPRLEIGDS